MSDKAGHGEKPSDKATPEKLVETIVIAEDSAPNLKILNHLLVKLGYEVIACTNGLDAWEKLNSPETINPVAVISDLMMPKEDGMTFLKRVRESEKFAALPFVLVTAVSDVDQIRAAKSLKVNGYILKPVTFHRVTQKLKELFPHKKFPEVKAA